jgi:proline dehydrogenase
MQAAAFHRILVNSMQYVPQSVVWQFSRRYIAGTQLEDAYQTVRTLNASGCTATIDVLGEDSVRGEQVYSARDLYLRALDDIEAANLDCNMSVKLSEMGLRINVDKCTDVMHSILSNARDHGNFVRIDMEDSSVTSVTLDIYRDLRAHFGNVGVAIQSCLRRTEKDVYELLRGGPTNVRLCKGIYIEPEEIAYRDADDIRMSFQRLLELLLEGGVKRVGIATHDPLLVTHAEDTIGRLGVSKDRYEFQMLLGVAGRLRKQLVEKGHPLRVYVPFGELWFNYSMRRLRENPHIAGHIVRNLFKRQ